MVFLLQFLQFPQGGKFPWKRCLIYIPVFQVFAE